jgi:hypothetical protein
LPDGCVRMEGRSVGAVGRLVVCPLGGLGVADACSLKRDDSA